MKPPMPYSGGKQAIAKKIVGLFPEHDHYIEPFAGALSVLLAKKPAKIETVNDINGNLVAFWRVLRDRPDELERVCALTPHARAEFIGARDLEDVDDLERARRVWVQLTQGRGARLQTRTGWRFVHGSNRMALARYLDGYLSRIAPAAERLRGVTIDCRDAFDVIHSYERPGALFYVDPPYLGSTRRGNQYAHELQTEDEHIHLLETLKATPAQVVLSGYASDLYRDHLAGWQMRSYQASSTSGSRRTEVIWTNFDAVPQLFADSA